jgi:hypothetical protein
MSRALVPPLAALAALAAGACGLPPMVSDTGYLGTWSRGNDRNVSIVAIAREGDRWLFRWTKRSLDGQYVVLCDWDGRCEETFRGKVIARYRITTRFENGSLHTDTVEERTFPEPLNSQFTDVMEVTDGGRTLWNYTIERDGETYEGMARPKRSFTKVADAVLEPPASGSP